MISWRVTGINGWAERPPAACRLRQNVTDLSDDEWRQAEAVDVSCHVVSAPAVHKAGLTPIASRRCRDCEVQDESRRTIDRPRPIPLVTSSSV